MTIYRKNALVIKNGQPHTVNVYVVAPYGINQYYCYIGGGAGRYYCHLEIDGSFTVR